MKVKNKLIIANCACAGSLILGMFFPTQSVFANGENNVYENSQTIESIKTTSVQPTIYKQRTFLIEGKGNVSKQAELQNRTPWAHFNPTGIEAGPNETITLYVEGVNPNRDTFAVNASLRDYSNTNSDDWGERWELESGKNTISFKNGGILYLSNENDGGTATVKVEGGIHIPVFEKGVHASEEWEKMMNAHPGSTRVELVSEHAFVTASLERAKKFSNNPQKLLENLDRSIEAQHKLAGYEKDSTNPAHRLDRNYQHLLENNLNDNMYAFASSFRTEYINDTIEFALDADKLETQGFVVWHEVGHMQQHQLLNFREMGEVNVNIFAMAAQTALGNPSRLEAESDYERIMEYLAKPSAEKDYDYIVDEGGGTDHFLKLGMLWQLHLSLGEEFYPNLHRTFREIPVEQRPNTDEEVKQLFMVLASKVATRDLTPFFDQWGLKPSEQTRSEIKALGHGILTEPIWESTDQNPVRLSGIEYPPLNEGETDTNSPTNNNSNSKPNDNQSQNMLDVSIEFQQNKVQYTLPADLHSGKFRVVAFQNGKYIGESYENHAYYSTIDKSSSDRFVITPKNITIKKGDQIEIYLMQDVPGTPVTRNNAQLLASKSY